jgi:CRP/FNR family transcriptional regulator
MGRSTSRDQDHLQLLGRKQPRQRMALFLRSLSDRLQQLGQPAAQLSLPMSREELASYLGLAIETVSRTLSRMQDDGIIAVDGRRLGLLDRSRLAELVHEPDERRAAS